jgi:hypothetical protein
MQQSCQFFQDLVVDQLDDPCFQNHFSFASHDPKRVYDCGMIIQSISLLCLA